MKQVIVCADDYALHPNVDAAIVSLIAQGRLTATSCMTLSPNWKNAARLLTADIQDKADIGLHLDFTEFPSIQRHPLSPLILKSLARLLSQKKLSEVIHLQLDSFEDALGRAPDYIDGHQHVHQLPQIREALLDAVMQRYRANPPWIRISRPPVQDGLKGRIIGLLGANSMAAQAKRLGLRHSKSLLGVYGFDQDRQSYSARCESWFTQAQNGDAFMCHPSVAVWPEDLIGQARVMEFDLLRSSDFAEMLKRNRIALGRGTQSGV